MQQVRAVGVGVVLTMLAVICGSAPRAGRVVFIPTGDAASPASTAGPGKPTMRRCKILAGPPNSIPNLLRHMAWPLAATPSERRVVGSSTGRKKSPKPNGWRGVRRSSARTMRLPFAPRE